MVFQTDKKGICLQAPYFITSEYHEAFFKFAKHMFPMWNQAELLMIVLPIASWDSPLPNLVESPLVWVVWRCRPPISFVAATKSQYIPTATRGLFLWGSNGAASLSSTSTTDPLSSVLNFALVTVKSYTSSKKILFFQFPFSLFPPYPMDTPQKWPSKKFLLSSSECYDQRDGNILGFFYLGSYLCKSPRITVSWVTIKSPK